jgi:hypothetical protein
VPKTIDLHQLAAEIAKIASATTDHETARGLLELVDRLLTDIGLPKNTATSPAPPRR